MSWRSPLIVAGIVAVVAAAGMGIALYGRGERVSSDGTGVRAQVESSEGTAVRSQLEPLEGTAVSGKRSGSDVTVPRAGSQTGPPAAAPKPAGKAVAGIPELDAPERPTIEYLAKDFASGLVRYRASLKVLGWQGSADSGALVVRLLSASPMGPGKVKVPLNIARTDFVVALERKIKSAAELEEGAPVVVEFRPTGDGFAAFLR